MPAKKPFWKSRTIVLNIVAAIVATAIEHDNPILITQVLAVLNIILRALTTTEIGLSSED
jgi:nicotinamide riboside transporter PnuC